MSVASLFSSSSEENDECNTLLSSTSHTPTLNTFVQNEDVSSNNTPYNSFEDFSSSNTDSDNDIPCSTTSEDPEKIIACWAIRHSITQSALNDLLTSLSKCHLFCNLPKDARTLLNTPTTISSKSIKGGKYCHFGIKNEIEYLFKLNKHLPSTLLLHVSIDGLPISKNPSSQMWPILGYFSNLHIEKPKVFIIGSYYGKTKPDDCNEYLKDFIDELCELINVGYVYNNVQINVILAAIICDTPAKSFILNIKGHTGKHSCLRCQTVGIWSNENKSVYFPDGSSSLRNHDDFVSYSDPELSSLSKPSRSHASLYVSYLIPSIFLISSYDVWARPTHIM